MIFAAMMLLMLDTILRATLARRLLYRCFPFQGLTVLMPGKLMVFLTTVIWFAWNQQAASVVLIVIQGLDIPPALVVTEKLQAFTTAEILMSKAPVIRIMPILFAASL